MTVSTGIITTIAGKGSDEYSGDGGAATSAGLSPSSVAVDSSGTVVCNTILLQFFNFIIPPGNVFIADRINHRIRLVAVSTDIISTIAGTGTGTYNGNEGTATSVALWYPTGIAVDSSG